MRKKIIIIVLILIAIITGGYLYLRYGVLKSKDFKPDLSTSKSILDLRPSLIAKLKQIVKDGSDGLYVLDIKDIEPDVANSKINLTGVTVLADSIVLKRLDSLKKAPDQTFKILATSIQVDGIQLSDLLSNDKIDLKNVFIIKPIIEVFKNEKAYNKTDRINDTLSLYDKIQKTLPGLSISKTLIKDAVIKNYNLDKKTTSTFNDLTIFLDELLIDSTTRQDASRFLYAKNAEITMRNYKLPTADSLYYLNFDSINISASKRNITALGVSFLPRISKENFIKNTKVRKDFFHIKATKLVLSGINFWEFATNEKLIATQADIYNCTFDDYINKEMPAKKFVSNNFPHQSLLKVSLGISIYKVKIHNMNLSYEEYNPNSGKSGKLYFDDINGDIENFTNIKSQIEKNNFMSFNVETKFMKRAPSKIAFKFNLAKAKTGEFTADVTSTSLSNDLLNPIAEPLGMFSLKSGNVKQLKVHIKGNNKKASADILLEYENLFIVPLKKDKDEKDGLKEKKFTAFIANLLLIKKENNGKPDDLRKFNYTIDRGIYPNFFTLNWKAILMGIIKTIGAPEKLAK